MNMDAETYEYTDPISTDIYYKNIADLSIEGTYYNANMTFDHNFAKNGHNLIANVVFSQWDGKVNSYTGIITSDAGWINNLNEITITVFIPIPLSNHVSKRSVIQSREQ